MSNDFGDQISCVVKDEDKKTQMFTKSKNEHLLVVFQFEVEMGNKKQDDVSMNKLENNEKGRQDEIKFKIRVDMALGQKKIDHL